MKTLLVDQNYEGSRLDRFIRESLGIPFSLVAGMSRRKKVLLNGKKTNYDARLKTGDEISILFEVENAIKPKIAIQKTEIITNNIVFEDENILAINKPTGVAVQGGVGIFHSIDAIAKFINPE